MTGVLDWRRERLSTPLFGALALFLSLSAGSVGLELGLQVLSAFCLVAAFRIWDDIADRSTDAAKASERVLLQITDLRPFWTTSLICWSLGTVGSLLLVGPVGPGLLLGTALCFGVLYSLKLGHRAHWVLLKYPVIVAALGATEWTTLALVYLCFCIYERIDDPELRRAPRALWRLSPYLVLTAGVTAAAVPTLSTWALPWTVAMGLSLWALTYERVVLAPVFFIYALFVFQGAPHA
jgi:hypothetical protein